MRNKSKRRRTLAGAGVIMASSSSEEEMVRFLPLDATGAADLAFEGDLTDEVPESEDGSGRAEEWVLLSAGAVRQENKKDFQQNNVTRASNNTFPHRRALQIGGFYVNL